MSGKDFSLGELERRALEALCAETFATREFVDGPSFRADHEDFVDVISHLARIRYVDEDTSNQTYGPTLLTLSEIDNDECKRVLGIGSMVLPLMYAHYKNKATRKTNILVKEMARQLGIERGELDFSLMLLRNSISPVLATYTTDLRQVEAYILPSEEILKRKSMADLIAIQTRWRDQALKSNGALPPFESFLPIAKPKTTVFDAELVEALPVGFRQILAEIETAVPNKLTCLAVMGMRAVLDMFACGLLEGDKGTFKEKMSLLKDRSLLNERQIRILEAALEVGHAAAHRAHVPSEEECRQVLDIVVHLLREHYLLAPNVLKLKATAPPRGKN